MATVVMLGNVSTDAGMSEAPRLEKPYALLQFEAAAAAAAARERLDGLWSAGLKRLLCAELVDGAVAAGGVDPRRDGATPRWVANNTSGRDAAVAAAAAAARGEAPAGLRVIVDVVTEEEELQILGGLAQWPWGTLSRR